MSDEKLRALERVALTSREAGEAFTKELRRRGLAFESCDWCWGAGWRLVSGALALCSFCRAGKPEERASAFTDRQLDLGRLRRLVRIGGWRGRAAVVIDRVLESMPKTATQKECRAALTRAYPFGPRENHPYRIWCDEVKKQLARRFGAKTDATLFEKKS